MPTDTDLDLAAIPAGLPPARRVAAVLRRIGAHFGAVSGTVHRLRGDGMLELVASFGVPDVLLPAVSVIPIGKGIAGAAAQRREPVTICNLQSDTSGVAKPAAKFTGVEGALAVPIIDDGHLLGVIGVGKAAAYTYSAEECALLTRLGQRLIDDLRAL